MSSHLRPRFPTLAPLSWGLSVLLLVVLAGVAGPAMLPPPAAAQPQKLVFASAGFEDSNRFWMVARPDHLQYDPFLETLLDVDAKTGEYTPRLAEKWSHTPDYKEWTFTLRKGVQFHYGFGQFTGREIGRASCRERVEMTVVAV